MTEEQIFPKQYVAAAKDKLQKQVVAKTIKEKNINKSIKKSVIDLPKFYNLSPTYMFDRFNTWNSGINAVISLIASSSIEDMLSVFEANRPETLTDYLKQQFLRIGKMLFSLVPKIEKHDFVKNFAIKTLILDNIYWVLSEKMTLEQAKTKTLKFIEYVDDDHFLKLTYYVMNAVFNSYADVHFDPIEKISLKDSYADFGVKLKSTCLNEITNFEKLTTLQQIEYLSKRPKNFSLKLEIDENKNIKDYRIHDSIYDDINIDISCSFSKENSKEKSLLKSIYKGRHDIPATIINSYLENDSYMSTDLKTRIRSMYESSIVYTTLDEILFS